MMNCPQECTYSQQINRYSLAYAYDDPNEALKWSEPLRVDSQSSNANLWRKTHGKDWNLLRPVIQDARSGSLIPANLLVRSRASTSSAPILYANAETSWPRIPRANSFNGEIFRGTLLPCRVSCTALSEFTQSTMWFILMGLDYRRRYINSDFIRWPKHNLFIAEPR